MDTKKSVRFFNFITKGSIYLLVFLLPIFFLPWTATALDFNKQALLVVLTFVSFFAWMIRVLISGKLELNLNKTHIAVLLLFLVYIFSTIFSLWSQGSFWGWPQIISESLITIIVLVALYFLISNVFSQKEVYISIILLAISSFLVFIFGILQLFGLFLLPFDFTKITSFNTIGSVGSFGFFAAALLPLMIVLLMSAKKWQRFFFGLIIFSILLVLVLVNYQTIWWLVLAGSVGLMAFGMQKRDIFESRWLILAMFFLGLSLFFILIKLQIGGLPAKPIEVYLNQKTTFDIALKTLKERPIFGSGPGTFVYDFSKYKKPDFNQGIFWNVRFEKGGSEILNSLATTGVLGTIALLFLMVCGLFYGLRFLLSSKFNFGQERNENQPLWFLVLGILVSFLVLTVGYFVTNLNFSLIFLYFFLIAGLIGLTSQEKKEYELKPSSLPTLIVTFAFTIFFIFGLGLLILDSQRYISQVNYFQGITAWGAGDIDKGIRDLEKAAGMNPTADVYFRQLSQAYLFKITDEFAKTDISQEEKNKRVQVLVGNAINAAKIATDINPKNVSNWSIRGFVYQNTGVDDWAIKSYDEAITLEPTNPYFPTQKGIVFFRKAEQLTEDKISEKQQALLQAKEQLEKAIELKSDYSDALYFLGLTYDGEGQRDKAIEKFSKVVELNPDNQDVQKILENLKAGKNALEDIVQEAPLQAPIEEAPK